MHFIDSLLLSIVGNKAEQKITFRARSLIINIFFCSGIVIGYRIYINRKQNTIFSSQIINFFRSVGQSNCNQALIIIKRYN